MKISTTRFGEIEYPEDVVLEFPEGVLGFPGQTRYLLLEHQPDGSPFKWLQSLDRADLAFIVLDPFYLEPGYQLDIDESTQRLIGTVEMGQCAVLCIVTVPRDLPLAMTANLKAPLLLNAETRVGRQVVLSSQTYSMLTPVFAETAVARERSIKQRAAV